MCRVALLAIKDEQARNAASTVAVIMAICSSC